MKRTNESRQRSAATAAGYPKLRQARASLYGSVAQRLTRLDRLIARLSTSDSLEHASDAALIDALAAGGAKSGLIYLQRRAGDRWVLGARGVDATALANWTNSVPDVPFAEWRIVSGEAHGGVVLFEPHRIASEDGAELRMIARLCGLAFDRIRRAQREAAERAEADRASGRVDVVLAKVSHELRDPLNAVIGWVRLLRATSADDEATRKLDVITRTLDVQKRLIEDLIEYSRFRTGEVGLNKSDVQLDDVVDAAVEISRMHADAKRIDLVASKTGVTLWCDPDRIQQVMVNLLGNAIKFTPGGGRVVVEADERDGKVEIAVHDTGKGIPLRWLQRVFEPFHQGDGGAPVGDLRPGTRGLGLGLTVVKELVELHGGTVRAEPRSPQGVTFRVTLPRGL